MVKDILLLTSYILHLYLVGAMTRRGAEHIGTRRARDKSVVEAGFDPYGFMREARNCYALQRYSSRQPISEGKYILIFIYI